MLVRTVVVINSLFIPIKECYILQRMVFRPFLSKDLYLCTSQVVQ